YVASSQQVQFHRVAGGDSGPIVTPFMQVGTSRASTVSCGVDYTFTCSQRGENLAARILPFARGIHLHGQLNNLSKTCFCQMLPLVNQLANLTEETYIALLR